MTQSHSPIRIEDLQGFKIINKFKKILEQNQPNTQTHPPTRRGPKRKILKCDYFSLFLFTFLNPILTSMRGLSEASYLEKVQEKICPNSVSRSTFSDAQHCFDPQLLLKVIQELSKKFQPTFGDKRLLKICKELVAVDGSLIKAVPRMSWALWQDESHRSAKLHLHYAFLRQTVINASITDANTCERAQLAKSLEKDFLYTADRYYGADYSFFLVFKKAGSFFVIRIRNNAVIQELESFQLTEEDKQAGVVYDKKVRLGKEPSEDAYRLIKIQAWNTTLLLLTNRWDIPAELISIIYRNRWEIEILFKWIKCNLNFRHLLAESLQGVTIQIYLAIIATLLLFLAVGHRPTKRQMELIHLFSLGWVSLRELTDGLKLKKRA